MSKAILRGAVLRAALLWAVLSFVLPVEANNPVWTTGHSGFWTAYVSSPKSVGMNTYSITSAEELAYVSYQVNYSGNTTEKNKWLRATLRLDADIDLGAHFWEPIWGDFSGTLDGNGHTIRNMYARLKDYSSNNNHCALLSHGGANFTVKNLTLEDCYSEGRYYTGLLFGQVKGGSGTVSNVRVRRGRLASHTCYSVGAIIGEVHSSEVTLEHCTVDADVSLSGEATGGLIGKLYSQADVTLTNCYVKLAGNGFFSTQYAYRGGLVGWVTKKSHVEVSQCGVQVASAVSPADRCALLVGSLAESGNCHIKGAYVNGCYEGSNVSLCDTRGSNTYGAEDVHYDMPTAASSQEGERAWKLMRMNEQGASVAWSGQSGLCFEAAADDKGRVVSLGTSKELTGKGARVTHISPVGTDDRALPATESMRTDWADYPYVAAAGLPIDYDVLPAADASGRWIMEDVSEGISDRKRVGWFTFRGTPSATGKLAFTTAARPVLSWRKKEYNPIRMTVAIEWTVADQAEFTRQWAAHGARWVVTRNGEAVDTLDAAQTSYEDTRFAFGEDNLYEVYLVSPALYYERADNPAVLQYTAHCDGLPTLEIAQSGKVGNVQVSVAMPNTDALSGCTIALYKVIDDGSGSATVPTPGSGAQPVQTMTFRSEGSNKDNFLRKTFTDTEAAAPCHKWRYKVMCYGFPQGPFEGKTLESNVVDMVAQSNVQLTSFTASKGESTDKVRIEWHTEADKAWRNLRYELSRHAFTGNDTIAAVLADDSGWSVIQNTTNENGVNLYTDEVLPGYVYLYRLRAYVPCDGTYSRDIYVEGSDIGFAASRGTIMGTVTYGTGSTAVKGVDVRLTPDSNTLEAKGSAYALNFASANDLLALAPGLGEKFWKGDWTVQLLVRPQANPERATLLTTPTGVQVDALQGTLLLAGQAMTLPERSGYNAVVLRHSTKEKAVRMGYALTPPVDSVSASPVHWCVTVADKVLQAWADTALVSPIQGNTEDLDPMLADKYDDPAQLLWLGSAHNDGARPAFNGYVDEVRVWSAALTEQEMANTYDRYLTGNEQQLAAYYTFDAGVAEMAFDASHPGGKWNNRHIALPRLGHPAPEPNVLPGSDVLCYRSTTDENGEYQIAGVPFVGEGTNYQVVPIYGTHEFQPASTRRYVSAQSLTHTAVNFSDQSAFTVPVQACYAFGNIPAEGLYVCVDGVAQYDDNQQLLRTDADGKATVSVPIGRHRLSLQASGHTLVADGLPCTVTSFSADGKPSYVSLADKSGLIDFQYDRTAPMTFYDQTLVRVVGRVAGGVEEAGKPVGFHQGKGNLGQMVLRFTPSLPKEYFVNDGKKNTTLNPSAAAQDIRVAGNAMDSIATTTLFPLMKTYAEVETDPATGEYLAMLPPVNWSVTSVKSKHDGTTDFDLSKIATSVSIDLTREQSDTLWRDTTAYHDPTATDTYSLFRYAAKRSFIHYTDPVVTLYNPYATLPDDSLMLGTDSISGFYLDPVEDVMVRESVPVWAKDVSHDGSKAAYLLGAPVFGTGERYTIRIRIAERYRNHDTGEETEVPLRGVKMQISNRLASIHFKEASTGSGGYELIDSVQTVRDTTQAAGVADYEFVGGIPNPAGNHLLPMTISYTVNATDYVHSIEGLVLGAVPQPGSNFVTKGPNRVFFVLRDPPGSSSTAWLESGTTVTASRSEITTTKGSYTGAYPATVGSKISNVVFGPFGNTYVFENSNEVQTSNGVVYKTDNEGSLTYTSNSSYTFTERVQTSGNFKYVGTDGDVYIGNSTNYIYSKSDNINILQNDAGPLVSPSGRRYALSQWQGTSKREEVGTVFKYSQKEIVSVQIPNLKKMRNACVPEGHWVSDLSTLADFEVPSVAERFNVYALASSRDKDVWVDGVDYKSAFPTSCSDENGVQDSVTLFNSWISGWEDCIANEERFKLEVFKSKESYTEYPSIGASVKYGYYGNTSFDTGAKVQQTFRFSDASSVAVAGSTFHSGGTKYATKALNKNVLIRGSEASTEKMVGLGFKHVGTTGGSSTGGFGYSLDDPDAGDHFSVDVWMPGSKTKSQAKGDGNVRLEPFVFRTVAGQSQHPWEKTQMTRYYKEDGQSVALDGGTENLDQPYIAFSQRRLTNVPSGTAASVKFTVANLSTATVSGVGSFLYELRCLNDDSGLEIRLNGNPITSGQKFLLPPNTSQDYTLTLKQSRVDVTRYDNLVFMLKYDNAAYDTLSVSFTPAAPQIALRASDGYVVNAERKDGRLPFQLSGYNADFYAFTGVRMQYKSATEQEWHTQKLLLNDRGRYEQYRGTLAEPWQVLKAGGDTATIDFSQLPEGTYQVRAESFSIVSNTEELTFDTDPLTVTKDTQAPALFGTPLPADGRYEPGTEISVTFNEPLNLAAITDDNFYVTAVLNDAEVTHKTGLHFDGAKPAKTSARVEMLNTSSAVGLWFKPVAGKRSCLLAQRVLGANGEKTDFKIFYNADSTLTLQAGANTFTSRRKVENGGDWVYLALTNDKRARRMDLYCLHGTSNKTESTMLVADMAQSWDIAESNTPLYVGGSADGDACYADMEGLAIYDSNLSFENIARQKGSKHGGNLRGLLAYWPMDEGTGLVAADKVRRRNLSLMGTDNWYMPVANYALTFDADKQQHAEINTSGFALTEQDDYVVELLFRTAEKQHAGLQALFSNGYGGEIMGGLEDFTEALDHFSISLDAQGSIVLAGGGEISEPMGSGYNDNQWHHLALNVQRDGYVTVMVDTVDVGNDYRMLGADFGNLAAAKVTLGALRTHVADADTFQVTNFFSGCIDEVRIWSAYKNSASVKAAAYQRLNGDEPGLVAYYPFERTDLVAGQEKTTPTIEDRVKANAATGLQPAPLPTLTGYPAAADSASLAAAVTTDKGMAMRAADFQNRIAIDWVCDKVNSNRISFSFPETLDKARIEDCTINFCVQNLKDACGNLQTQPVRWSFVVDQKAIDAAIAQSSLTQEIGTATSTQLILYNNAASTTEYTIDNVPTWLKLTDTNGTLAPHGYTTLTLSTNEGTGIGRYMTTLYVTGGDGLQSAVPVTLTVTGKKPGWTAVDNGSGEWMALLGMLKVKDAWSTNESDIVAAFDADGVCHGTASPQYSPEMDAYFVHLDLYGGMPAKSDTLTFKVWEAATGMTYSHVAVGDEALEKLAFEDRKFIGSFTRPCIINALPVNEQHIELQQGWNWVSLWVQPRHKTIDDVFQVGRGSVVEVKQWRSQGPRGVPVTEVNPAQSYHVYAAEPCSLTVEGAPISADTVAMRFLYGSTTTWAWLGFPVSHAMTLEQAFADFQPTSGDVVKSTGSYAVYNGTAWVGKLRYLTPGEGYHYGYNGTDNISWSYPDATVRTASARTAAPWRDETDTHHFVLDINPLLYEDYTATQVIVVGDDGQRYGAPIELAAFDSQGFCRGVIDLQPGQTGPMAIFGKAGEEFSFRLWDKAQQAELPLWGTKLYDEKTPCQTVTLYLSADGIRSAATAADRESPAYDTQGRRYGDHKHRRSVLVEKGKKTTVR